jgi:hypothetical protein
VEVTGEGQTGRVSVERGNPDGVRPLLVGGKPTVRKAQLPGGNRMTREANAGGRKATSILAFRP